MNFMRSLGWSAVEIGAGLGVGYGVHSIGGDLISALVWCAVVAGFIGYIEGLLDQ